jgi:hypothetical protein
VITRLNRCYPFPDGFDNAPSFVAENAWEETLGIMSVKRVDICMAESVGDNFHAHFASLWGVDGDGFEGERLFGPSGYHCLACDGLAGGRHD